MIEEIAGWFFGIWGIICIGYIVIWNAVRLIKAVQCHKIKYKCECMQCWWRHSCNKYDTKKEEVDFMKKIMSK